MSILVDKDTRLLVQGITGREGTFHTGQMVEYGTNVVAGVTPGRAGKAVHGVPVYDTVKEAVEQTGANASIVYVPARFAPDAILESVDAGIPLIVCISEHVPVNEMVKVHARVKASGSRLIGPNCPGLITPDEAKVGIMPAYIHKRGIVGLVSRSGTLTYEVVWALTESGLGQTSAVGIGGDPIIGTNFIDILELYEADEETEGICLLGEIGGDDEEQAAAYIKDHITKPVAAFIAGQTAPPGKRMGHAGAIISGGTGTARAKVQALTEAGAMVAERPSDVAGLLKDRLG